MAYLIKNLVDLPDSININIIEEPQGMIVEIRAAEGDIAKIIGRQGRTIKALRTIALTIGARFGQRIRVNLIQ